MMRLIAIVCLALCGAGVGGVEVSAQAAHDAGRAEDDLTMVRPESVGLAAGPLEAMEQAVGSGEFKLRRSVLVARHGKLVYEHYFDGDRNTLRDTRSATKSITDVLVGIAIAEGKLSGVNARVLALLTERARKLQNPDPRKDKDHGGGFPHYEFATGVR